jgi:hypothetical protein
MTGRRGDHVVASINGDKVSGLLCHGIYLADAAAAQADRVPDTDRLVCNDSFPADSQARADGRRMHRTDYAGSSLRAMPAIGVPA